MQCSTDKNGCILAQKNWHHDCRTTPSATGARKTPPLPLQPHSTTAEERMRMPGRATVAMETNLQSQTNHSLMRQVKKWLGLWLWAKGAPRCKGRQRILPPTPLFFLPESVKARGQSQKSIEKEGCVGSGGGEGQQGVAGDFNSQIFLWATFNPSPTKRLRGVFLSLPPAVKRGESLGYVPI